MMMDKMYPEMMSFLNEMAIVQHSESNWIWGWFM